MDNKEYISSGILELYAAGLLTDAESKNVEEIIRNNSDVKTDYENIQKTIYVSALPKIKTPDAKVKASILNKINERDSYVEKKSLRPELKYDRPRAVNTFRYLMAASVAFLILSLGTNFFLWTKLNDARNEITVMNDQKKIMTQEFEKVSGKLNRASQDMEIMKDRNYKMVDLKGLEKSPGSNVVAFWNPESKKVYIEVLSLPVPPPDKQYQLWAISDGKPVDAGVMDVDPSDKSLHVMKSMDDAQAFAVTLEPKGGSVNPTMDQMYVMGKI